MVSKHGRDKKTLAKTKATGVEAPKKSKEKEKEKEKEKAPKEKEQKIVKAPGAEVIESLIETPEEPYGSSGVCFLYKEVL